VLGAEVAVSQHPIHRPEHPPQVLQRAREVVCGLDHFALSALQCVTMECKSLLLALAVVHRQITIEQVSNAACSRNLRITD
jgi:chaperone required for assembly of F1-ATPase